MYTRRWATSPRIHEVVVERDVKVRMPDGTHLDGNVYRPASPGRYPVLLGAHPYNKDLQSPPLRPIGFTPMRGFMRLARPELARYRRSSARSQIPPTRGSGDFDRARLRRS